MVRRRREDEPGSWHHVMNRGADHQRTFFIRRDGLDFERLLGEGHERFGVEVHAYCLMPNHFHLLVHCPGGDLGRFMQHVTSTYTRRVNDRIGRDGALFRGRYHAMRVRDERYLLTAARYIHRNPLAFESTASLADHRWSSHGIYVGRRRRPDWLRTERVLDFFEGGAPAFDEAVSDSRVSQWPGVPDGHLIEFIDLLIDEHDQSSTSEHKRASRTVTLALVDHVDPATGSRLIAALGLTDGVATQRARRRASERIAESTALRELVQVIHHRAA